MKKLFLLLCFLGSQAWADATPMRVAQECVRQMSLGICTVKPNRASLSPGATRLFSKIGRLDAFAYQDYMDEYNEKVPTDPAMCDLALYHMTYNVGSDHDKIARALWTPPEDAEPQADPQAVANAAINAAKAKQERAAAFISVALLIGLIAVFAWPSNGASKEEVVIP